MPTVLKPTSATISAGLQEKAADNRDKGHGNKILLQLYAGNITKKRRFTGNPMNLLSSTMIRIFYFFTTRPVSTSPSANVTLPEEQLR